MRGAALVIIVLMILGGLLSFGDPQWGKHVYMFQSFTLGRGAPEVPSSHYFGPWREWDETGILRLEMTYENGITQGVYRKSSSDGVLVEEGVYADGVVVGVLKKKLNNHDKEGDFTEFNFERSSSGELLKIVGKSSYGEEFDVFIESGLDRRSEFDIEPDGVPCKNPDEQK